MKLFLFNNDEKLIGTVSPLEGIQNEEINKIQTIECTVVYSELIEKASYIGHKDYSDNRIFHMYKIDHVTKTSTTDVKIVGVHTFFDDMESDGYVKDFRPTNRELVGVLTTILDGSRWQLGTVNIQRRYTGNFYYVTRKEAISKLIEATQIEIKPRLEFSRGKITGRYLDVFTRLGARNGKVFVHGRDLLTVSEKKSQGAIYTAVVGRGKGEETDTGGYGRRISFKDVEWRRTSGQPVDKPVGQEYVEIPAMTKLYGFEKGTKPRIKIVEFQDEADKEKLLRLSYEWLEKNSRMQVEYSAKVLNVGNLELGDTVGIFNPKLGIKYETRVFKVKRNLVDNKLTEFGIGDKVTTSPFSRTIELAKEMKNFQDDTVYWLDKIRERLSDKLINEDGYNYDLKADNEYKVPAGYYSFDKPIDQNPTKVVYMGAGKIAIANSKKPTGEWNWRTFLDGRGATLDLINTGVLKAGRIQSADGRSYWDLDTGEFHMEQSAINEAVKTVVNGKVQEIVGEVKKNLPTKEELKGKSSYLHKKYSDYPDGRNMNDNSTLKYIGIYTGDKQQAPSNASEYSWTKIRGEDGRDGVDGNNGRDGADGKSINENLLPNSNFNQGFEKWEDKLTNSGLNHSFDHANTNFGRGLHIWGTSNADYKGLSSVPFNLVAKQGDKLTLSMDLGKDALTQNAPLRLALHYMDDKDAIVSQQWQTIDLATQNFEVRKYKRISMVFTVQNEIRKCRVMIYATVRQLINFYIDNIKLERGDTATDWSPAYEDLRGRDGVSSYIHRKYSDYSSGYGMDDNPNRKYIGIYTGTNPTPPTTASSYLWSKIKGEDGANGTPGVKGADGRTPYFHTAYANSPTGDRDFSTTNSNDKLYIGTYSDFEVADSTDYRKYKWVKIKGEDGRNGVSSYIYRKYSDNANGSPMSDNSNLKYIGIYTGTSATAPTTPSAYTWSKIKGEDGQQGVPGARGSDGRTSYLHTAYANSATGDRDFSTTNSNGKEYIGTYTDFEINDSNDYRRYKWVKIKGENGRDGNNGRDGRDGNVELNLLNGTKEFVKSQFASPDNFQKNLVWIDEIERYEDFAVKSTIYQFNGLWQNVKVEKGKTYEFGFFAKGSRDTDRILFSPGWASSSAKQPLAQYNINSIPFKLTTAWKFYSFRFTVTQTGWSQCRVEKNEVNNGIKFSLCGLYLKELKNDQSSPLGWSPSIEDLQGHSLTANLWFSGNYINNVTSNVRLNLVVYYDGKEIRDFNANIKYVGGGINDWRTQENVRVLRDNTVDYGFWSNSEKNGTPLFALAIVSYKGLQIISDARLDNVPNVEDIKETIKKFKTFESTLDSFKSVIGEIKSKEIKTIINTPNLCTEDFSNNKSKRGNDLYFNVSPSLKANTKYTVIVDVSLEKVEVHQKTKVYGAKSGGGEQWLKSGRNVWIVDYATEQTRVNIYPLGEFSKVFNVEIYEGDYREFIEQNNRFVSMDTAKREQSGFYSYKINHNINNGKGKYFLVKFDLASLPADKWFASGDNGTLALYSFGAKQFTEELKLKDNEYIFKAHLDDTFYIFHSTNSLNLINVRLYEVRFGVTLATQNSLIDISSMIDQSKEAVTLSARKEIEGKLTNYPTNAYLSNNFANKQDLENLVSKSELKVLSDRIESSVNTGNFGTTLSQNAYYVRVAWNSISNYVQFENGGLNFYEGSTTQNNLRARIDDGNYTFWRDGYNLGNMGTGYYAKDNNKKGIQFHLEYDGWFMGWAYKQKRTDNFYTWKWYYTSGSVGDTYADTLNAGCNTNFRWNEIWYFKTRTSWFNIMDGLNGTISVVSNIENTGDGGIRWWTRNLTFKNGILIGG
jgi:phage minor structural protein